MLLLWAATNYLIYCRDLPILIVIVSLVYGATRFEDWPDIFMESFRWMVRLTVFLGSVIVVLTLLERLLM